MGPMSCISLPVAADQVSLRHVTRVSFMAESILSLLAVIRVFVRSRRDTALEVLALRQQVAVLKRKRPRPILNPLERLFWTTLRRFWSRWSEVLVIVKPETVVGWHRTGFRLYWRWRSPPKGDWGTPKIHGEILKLGFIVSERRWPGICDAFGAAAIRANGGLPFFTITAR
jgi:hypothetical protein